MFKSLSILLLVLLLSPITLANGSGTASEGSAIASVGSAMVVAVGAVALSEVIHTSGHLVVASVETTGDLIVLTLDTVLSGVQGSTQIVIELSASAMITSLLVAGSIIKATSVMAVGGSIVIGHLLVHAGEVVLFIPQHALALGLHSHKL